jgi:hypothetical protein
VRDGKSQRVVYAKLFNHLASALFVRAVRRMSCVCTCFLTAHTNTTLTCEEGSMAPVRSPRCSLSSVALSPKKPKQRKASKQKTNKTEIKIKIKLKTQDAKFRKRNKQTSRAPAGIIAYTHIQILHSRLRSAVDPRENGQSQRNARVVGKSKSCSYRRAGDLESRSCHPSKEAERSKFRSVFRTLLNLMSCRCCSSRQLL